MIKMEPVPSENKTASGIIVSLNEERTQQGKAELIEVGGNAFEGWEYPIPRVGDTVLVNRYEAVPISDKKDEEMHMINDKGVAGIFSEGTMSELILRDVMDEEPGT